MLRLSAGYCFRCTYRLPSSNSPSFSFREDAINSLGRTSPPSVPIQRGPWFQAWKGFVRHITEALAVAQ